MGFAERAQGKGVGGCLFYGAAAGGAAARTSMMAAAGDGEAKNAASPGRAARECECRGLRQLHSS